MIQRMTKRHIAIWASILGGVVGIIAIIVWILEGLHTQPSFVEPDIQTNNIIEEPAHMPTSCQELKKIFECILSSNLEDRILQALQQHYHQSLSERNTLTDKDLLDQECTQEYDYVTSLDSTTYADTIAQCKTL